MEEGGDVCGTCGKRGNVGMRGARVVCWSVLVCVCVYRVSARVPSCGAAFLFAYSFLRAWWRLSARSEVRFVSLGGWLRQHGAEPPARPANGRPA